MTANVAQQETRATNCRKFMLETKENLQEGTFDSISFVQHSNLLTWTGSEGPIFVLHTQVRSGPFACLKPIS